MTKNFTFNSQKEKNICIVIKNNSIKYYLQKSMEINYLSDKLFISDISKINLAFDEGNYNLTNIRFCYGYTNLINLKNKNKLDKYIIFTSEYQMNLILNAIKL